MNAETRIDYTKRLRLDELATEIRDINAANGWKPLIHEDWDEPFNKVPATLALIHSEVSEALEAFRKGDLDNFMEEGADILIRVLDCFAGFGNIEAAVAAKLEKNRSRGYRHGGKRV